MVTRATRVFPGPLVTLLITSLLCAQSRALTQPMFSTAAPAVAVQSGAAAPAAVSTPAPVAASQAPAPASSSSDVDSSASEVQTSASAPADTVPLAEESPTGDVTTASTVEPEYFSGGLGASYPLSLPAGRRGMTPAVALEYSSGAGNGWVGVGWDLDLGAIQRQAKNGVDFAGNRYVFRTNHSAETLVPLAGSTTMFATEIASRFEKFEKKTAADGRSWWVVTDRFGTTREYGPTNDSRTANPADPTQIFAWHLTAIRDALGNSILVTYAGDSGTLYLKSIRYTESPNLGGSHVVTFETEARTDVETSFALGWSVQTRLRLKRINVVSAGRPMPSFELDYGATDSDATGRSLVRSISVVAPDGRRLPPTQYRYQGTAPATTNPIWTNGPDVAALARDCFSGDFNGDSRSDVSCHKGAGNWSMTLSSGANWATTSILGPTPGSPANDQCAVMELNADGRTDLACYTKQGGQWHVMYGTAAGWDPNASKTIFTSTLTTNRSIGSQCLFGDYNDDGRTDFACWKGQGNWEWTLSRGDVWQAPVPVTGPTIAFDASSRCTTGDFDGDGRTDITCFTGVNENGQWKWYFGFSTGTAWRNAILNGRNSDVPISNHCLFGDVSGDGRTDQLCWVAGNQWIVRAMTNTGFDQGATFTGPSSVQVPNRNCMTGDMNGDGKSDLSCFNYGSKQWQTYVSTGLDFRAAGTPAGPSPTKYLFEQCIPGDYNGDGKTDMACQSDKDRWQLMLSDGRASDLLSGTTNIFGGTMAFEYAHVSTTNNVRIPLPIYVLSKTTSNDGSRNAVTTITYGGGYYDMATRDFRGFRNARVAGPRTNGAGATAIVRYHQGSSTDFAVNDAAAEGGYMRGRPSSVTLLDQNDAIVRETRFTYQPSSAIPRFNPLIETVGRTCERGTCRETRVVQTYDRFGNVERVEDSGDVTTTDDDRTKITTYAYNEARHIVSMPLSEEVREGVPGSRRISFTRYFFEGTNSCTTASTNTVPARGLVTRVVRWVGDGAADVEERTAFDDYGNLTCKADGLGHRTTFAFDATRQFVVSTDNALGHRTSFSYYGVENAPVDRGLWGLLRTVTDANGSVATTDWDPLGRRTRLQSPGGTIVTWQYNDLGIPLRQNIRVASGSLVTTEILDGMGRAVITRRSGPEGKTIVSQVRYDERGLMVGTSLPYFAEQALVGEATTTYDALRRPLDELDAAGGRRSYCYSNGAVDVVDENGHRIRRMMTATGQLVQVARYSGTSTRDCATLAIDNAVPYSVTRYRHDPAGRLVQVVDAKGVATTLSWDGLSRRTSLIDPSIGERRFTYDAAGNATGWTSPSGSAVFITYDALRRPLQKDYFTRKALGAGDIVNTYDQAGRNGIGRLTASKAPGITTSIAYDAEGRPTTVDRTIDGTTYREGRRYDELGRVGELHYPDGKVVVYVYDGPALSTVRDHTRTYAQLRQYNAAVLPGQLQLQNGTTTTFRYEVPSNPDCARATYRLCGSTTTPGDGTAPFSIGYTHDAKGNVTVTREGNVTRSLIYDDFDRIRAIAVSTTGVIANSEFRDRVIKADLAREFPALSVPSPILTLAEGFSYDATDNLTWKWDVGTYEYIAPSAAAMNPHAPRKAGSETLTWDRDGNMVAAGLRSFAFDVEGRLVAADQKSGKRRSVGHGGGTEPAAASSRQIQYDASGSRFRETGPAGTTIYVGDLAECRPGAGCVNHIFAGSTRIATERPNDQTVYYHPDHQGSPRRITDAAGRIAATLSYSAFGVPSNGNPLGGILPTSFLFSDQPYSSDVGVYVFSGRAYDPKLGRFISPDEVVAVPGSPATLNRYAYGHNNPLSVVDPDGHHPFAIFVAMILSAFLGGVKAYMEGRDWKRGALSAALQVGLASIPDALALTGMVRYVVSIATGAAKAGITAALAGGNIGWSIVEGAVHSAVDNADAAGIKPIEWWGSSDGSDIVAAANQLTNGALKAATYGGLRSAKADGDIAQGAIMGLANWAVEDAAEVAIGHVNTLLGPQLGGSFDKSTGVFKRDDPAKSETKPQDTKPQPERLGNPDRRSDGQSVPAPVIDNGGLSLGSAAAWLRQNRDRKPVTP